ncbi:unnamed protein product [Hyaloperonospora brassicae]|uniref:Uncharacterized protein n=1 Tax=Hyaloperonospora brassicae TaxID=162125 RepID=A0AAV0UB95_HYABA|nr:unnamed protein product [Hyaloperonospora brassicae]
MPKRKANWWPSSILSDPDVLSMDDEGRFVLCKICHVHYAVHGGKKPKPVIMNSNFRTRAWDVHKERTNSHRLQKRQQQQQQQEQQQQQQQEQKQQLKKAPTTQEQVVQTAATTAQSLHDNVLEPVQQRQQQVRVQPNSPVQIQSQTRTPSLAGAVHTAQNRAQTPVPTQGLIRSHSGTQVSQQRRQRQQQLQQLQRLQDSDDTDDAGHDRLQVAARECAAEKPVSPRLQATPAVDAVSVCSSGPLPSNKRSAAAMPLGAPISRRRAFRAGSPRSPRHVIADLAVHSHEKHSFMVPGSVSRAKGSPAPSEHAIAMEQQADSSARWRHMHDDVSRALSPSPRRRQQGPASYTSGELRAAKTLVQTETGDLGGNNSERVAKKLRSLNAEYHASNMRYADAYNMRHTFDILDRSSAGYKEYWGTLRDVYTSSGVSGAGAGSGMSYRKSYHRGNPSAKSTQECTEAEAETTTPEDSGSSEDAFKPAVVVHDTSLINAIEKLTDAASKQIANLYEQKATGTREALTGLTLVMTDLRVQCGQAFERMIELQEKNLKVMGSILDVKLRKEAARNARTGCSDNELSSAGSTGTGCESIGLT